MIAVQVAYGTQAAQTVIDLEVPEGASIADAIALSGVCAAHPEIDPGSLQSGVWGKARNHDFVLREGDRVEIYRWLKADPKEARRARASKERNR